MSPLTVWGEALVWSLTERGASHELMQKKATVHHSQLQGICSALDV